MLLYLCFIESSDFRILLWKQQQNVVEKSQNQPNRIEKSVTVKKANETKHTRVHVDMAQKKPQTNLWMQTELPVQVGVLKTHRVAGDSSSVIAKPGALCRTELASPGGRADSPLSAARFTVCTAVPSGHVSAG